MLRALNSTFLALIPKGEGVDRISQFRPISLCNVIYKIIFKLIVDRLKKKREPPPYQSPKLI